MRHGDVVALIVHVADRLPVDRRASASRCRRKGPSRRRDKVRIPLRSVRAARRPTAAARLRKRTKMKPIQISRSSGVSPNSCLVEFREGARPRRAAQGAVEIVDPAVERADQRVLAGALVVGHDAPAAMPAHIVEAAHDAVLAAHYQRPLADHVHGQIVAGVGHVRDVSGDLPVAAEDVFLLEFEQRRAVVGPARQAAPIPIVRNRHVTRCAFMRYALLI